MSIENETPANALPERWGACGILLSMDCIQPFVDPMGLQLDAGKLKNALREAITANRVRFDSQSDDKSTFATHVVEYIDLRLGETAKKEFVTWFSRVFTFDVHEHRAWQHWQSAFLRFSSNAKSWKQLVLPQRCSASLYEKFLGVMYGVNISALWEKEKSGILSEWDLQMYAIHEFDDGAKDPFNWVVLTYENNCFRRFWPEVLAAVNDQELMALWHALKDDPTLAPTSHMHSLPSPLTLAEEQSL